MNIVSLLHRINKLPKNLIYTLRFSKYCYHLTRIPGKIQSKEKTLTNFLFCKDVLQLRENSSLSNSSYETVCKETLESLSDFFEELVEEHTEFSNADISYNDGVLTINLGKRYGTYVINRQLPNKQIWLSSPLSGPKRYDFENNGWIYKHDNQSLHSLLQIELSKLLNKTVNLSHCSHYINSNME